MKSYIIYNNLGKILRTGVCLDEHFNIQVGANECIIEGTANPDINYIEDANIISMGIKPSENHVFDYSTKQWVFDKNLASEKAIIQRNQLLAEGPDRINPMWWASMTEQEQQAWTLYRQSLLDITEQADYPEFIVWPIKP